MKHLSEADRYALFWREIVFQALRDAITPQMENASAEDQQDAIDWLSSDNVMVGSVRWACREAGLDVQEVRDAYFNWREKRCWPEQSADVLMDPLYFTRG